MSNLDDFLNKTKSSEPVEAMASLEKELDARIRDRIDNMRSNISSTMNKGDDDE